MNVEQTQQRYFRVFQAAKAYGIGKTTIWNNIKSGRIKAYRPSTGITLICFDEMEKFIKGEKK